MLKIVDPGKLEWYDPPRGYYLSEVKEKVLWRDEETGAKIAMVKAPVGVMDRRHTHPEANQFARAGARALHDRGGDHRDILLEWAAQARGRGVKSINIGFESSQP